MILHARVLPASNATFVGELDGRRVVYKPVAGERPLWDFPDGTLASREVASYVVSEALGWDIVPRTWLGDGPLGAGMLQEWREPDPESCAVDVVPADELPAGWRHVFDGLDGDDRPVSLVHEDTPALRRMAIFDVVVNNADRKGGHVLAMADGHRYGVDHGLTFHVDPKLRTVLWGWLGEPLDDAEAEILARLPGLVGDRLASLLAPEEVDAFARRCVALAAEGMMPTPSGEWPAIPWPPF